MTSKEKKIVEKPWGREEWLELDKYCFKKLFIIAGKRTSLQYHNKKIETMYFLDGIAKVLIENENGEMEEKEVKAGEFLTIHPPKKHRVTAVTDITYLEASTPEVEDLVRVEDDFLRKNEN